MQIQPNPAWDIKDSSKLSDYLTCKRLYFYQHILGWHPEYPAHDLLFGEAWHRAREYQLIHGYDDIEGAYNSFITFYRTHYSPEDDAMHIPKTPTAVLAALMKFADERRSDLVENEVVEIEGKKMTEISGTVLINDNKALHYRMDSIMRRKSDGMIFSWDHKTTSESYLKYDQWERQFDLSIQNGTYTHCLYCIFPIDKVLGVEFCGTGFGYLKRGSAISPKGPRISLKRYPAFKSPDQMNTWLWTVNDIVDDIERETDKLSHCSDNDQTMMSFPLNPSSCTKYRGCPFHDYCIAWANPLQRCDEPPLGFKVEFWDPSAVETTNTLNLNMQEAVANGLFI